MIVDSISQVVYIMIYLPSTITVLRSSDRGSMVRCFFRRQGTWPRRAPATRPTAPRWCLRDPSRVSRMSPPRRKNGGWVDMADQGTKKNRQKMPLLSHEIP